MFSKYVNKVYDMLQDKIKTDHPRAVNYCGSTACVTIHCVDPEEKKNYLWMLNVGDSRAVLSNKNGLAVQLSQDHKPNSPDERNRIEQMGGKISFDGSDWRVKDLSVSRAFGDLDAQPFLTNRPDVYRHRIKKNDKFMIMACDGLWDVFDNQEAVNIILEELDKLTKNKSTNGTGKNNIARTLGEYAVQKGSFDNITIIIIFFSKEDNK